MLFCVYENSFCLKKVNSRLKALFRKELVADNMRGYVSKIEIGTKTCKSDWILFRKADNSKIDGALDEFGAELCGNEQTSMNQC